MQGFTGSTIYFPTIFYIFYIILVQLKKKKKNALEVITFDIC